MDFVQHLREIDAQTQIDLDSALCYDRVWFHQTFSRKYRSVWLTPGKVFADIRKKDSREFYAEKRAKKREKYFIRAREKIDSACKGREQLSLEQVQLEVRQKKVVDKLISFANHINALRELGFKLDHAEIVEKNHLDIEDRLRQVQEDILRCDYWEMAGERILAFLLKQKTL